MTRAVRILWYSNSPHAPSGYGNQTNLFVPRLKNRLDHEVAIAAFWGLEGCKVESDGITIYPKSIGSPYGPESMAVPALDFKADLIISLMDVWALGAGVNGGIPIAPWYPVDHGPLPPPIRDRLQPGPQNPFGASGPAMAIAMSRFGECMTREAGIDCRYVPHGVDTAAFAPMDKREARSAIGLPDDGRFVFGIVAANQGAPSRKALKEQMEAFARVHARHPDTLLYLHTRVNAAGYGGMGGENLVEMAEQLGINNDNSLACTNQAAYQFGLQSEEMRALYNSFDILTNVSLGEGFGIPILEAQACGVPVVVGDWTAMSELCFSGWKVPREDSRRWHTPLGAYQWWPTIDGIERQMEAAYLSDTSNLANRGRVARKRALEYDADLVCDTYWAPVLNEIAEKLTADQCQPLSFEEHVRVAG
jgi:glycosyltransferase involved in cell wall biosynthesis